MANEYLYKPDIIKIRGVHGTNEGDNQEADIGFPMVGMHTLFENAVIKAYDGDYTDTKKLAYKREGETTYTDIEDKGHFNCMKYGYDEFVDKTIDHYYIHERWDSDYIYHKIPALDTWAAKYDFSKTVIEPNKGKIYPPLSSDVTDRFLSIDDNNYFLKVGNDYIKQTVRSYHLYDEATTIDWSENNKYTRSSKIMKDESGKTNIVKIWKNTENGYYIYRVSGQTIRLYNIEFDENGIWINDPGENDASLYKLNSGDLTNTSSLYIKNGDKLVKLEEGQSVTLTGSTLPNIIYKRKAETWKYPTTEPAPDAALYSNPDNKYLTKGQLPALYTGYTPMPASIISNELHDIYEKTGVLLNYKYNDKGDILKIPFVEEGRKIDDILTICNLDDRLANYVHLTNLTYVE